MKYLDDDDEKLGLELWPLANFGRDEDNDEDDEDDIFRLSTTTS